MPVTNHPTNETGIDTNRSINIIFHSMETNRSGNKKNRPGKGKSLQEFEVSHGQQPEFLFKAFGEVRRAAES